MHDDRGRRVPKLEKVYLSILSGEKGVLLNQRQRTLNPVEKLYGSETWLVKMEHG